MARAPIRAQWTRTGAIGGREGAVLTRGYIRGGPELLRKLQQLEKGVKDELLAQATWKGAEVLAAEWKSRVPIDEGTYRDAILARAKAGKTGATGLVEVGVAPVADDEQPRLYASRLEFGSARATHATLTSGRSDFATRARKAQPSLRPAFDAVKGEMLDAMSDEVARLIEQAV